MDGVDVLAGGVPKLIHRVWLGPEVPEEVLRFGQRWQELHPGWRVVLWRDWTLPALRNQAAFDRSGSASQRSDVVRYELLLRWGGVYLDTDFEPLQPLDDVLAGVTCAAAREDDRWVAGGLVAAVPNHPFIASVVEAIGPRVLGSDGTLAPNVLTGPYFLTEQLEGWWAAGHDGITVFPPELFYPYHFSEPHRRGERFPGAYAVHHWAGSWRDAG